MLRLNSSKSTQMEALLSFFFSHFLLLFKYSCLHFPSTTPPRPSHPHFLPLILPCFGFVHVSFIYVPENPSPFSSHYPLLFFFFKKNPHLRTFFSLLLEGRGERKRTRERGRKREEKERERETLIGCFLVWARPGRASALTGDQTCNPGMCPDLDLNPQSFGPWGDAPTNGATPARARSISNLEERISVSQEIEKRLINP